MQFVVPVAGTEAQAWDMLTAGLGLKGLSVGPHWTAPAGVPSVAPAGVIDIRADTSGGPIMLKTRGPMLAKALAGTSEGSVSVDLATMMSKNLRAVLAQAALGRVRLPLAALTLQSLEQASAQGLAAADCTQLPVLWLKAAGQD